MRLYIQLKDGMYIVAVVTDNLANFKAMRKILHDKMPQIDIGKMEDVQKTIDEGKMVTGLIYNHQFMTDLQREMNQGCELLRPEQRSREKYGTYYRKLWKIIDNQWDNQLNQDIHVAVMDYTL
ncbi:WEB family-like protein [Cinnamomum micranthum f. kanehirae]|uniref:WEB family-like protein n=1 Tax=Cinnamomum micranthum f. kanehirae TaxID=337451 RepID=A0A443NNI6_9MAGN|nr:WEB family-like protein [Cinnamomum micranthum f. kanehirae]